MIKLKILYLYLIWIEGFPPKGQVEQSPFDMITR